MAVYSFLSSAPWISDAILPILTAFLSYGGILFLLCYTFIQLPRCFTPLRKLPYPPGPPSKDFISGNARDLLASPLWVTLTDWAAKYGSVMHIRAFDKHMIVLSSVDDAVELMDKRSYVYSDRPYVPMMELTGSTFSTPFKSYGPAWHAHRRLFQKMFHPGASLQYRPTQVEKVTDMLCSLLDVPEDFATHIKTLSASIIMSTMYGYKVLPQNDPFQKLAEETVAATLRLSYPGAAIVNVLPFLRFLPTWFPGARFHGVARGVKQLVDKLQEAPYKYVQDSLVSGNAVPSFVARLLEDCKSEEDHSLLKEVAATGYAAGADTTTSSLTTFIYAMAKYPGIQKKAQEQLDRIIGTDRLANFDDEGSLPYIQAIYREVLRWRPVLPLCVFHATTTGDVYNGYYIPKGAAIIPNIWAMTRDPLKYNDPEEFNPDRFLDESNELNGDDVAYVFGFGRRICPGRHLAASTVWLAIATILSTFDIRAPKDTSDIDIPFDVEYTSSLISHPHPFKCVITPRSTKAKQLIMDIRNNGV